MASVLFERIPLALAAGSASDPTVVAELEERQAEPLSYYLEYTAGGVVLVDSEWQLGDTRAGRLVLTLEPGAWPLRGAVAEVWTDATMIAVAHQAVLGSFGPQAQPLQGRWARLSKAPPGADATAVLAAVTGEHPHLVRPVWKQMGQQLVDVVGVVLAEEVGWRTSGEGWLFLIRYQDRAGRPPRTRVQMIRGGRAGLSDLTPRIPELRALGTKAIAVAGLGALGAPAAIEFAKAGLGRLHLLDFDHVEAGTTPRWPLGLQAVGHQKVQALGGFLAAQHPYTTTLVWQHQIGAPSAGDHELELIDGFLDGVSLLYDASAEIGVQHFLSDIARARGLPYLCVSATHGAWGGIVARIDPDSGGCWICLQLALDDGTIPVPPRDPADLVQPAGCASPTFTGSGLELGFVALAGVRTAVGYLGVESGFDWSEHAVTVVSLRDGVGNLIAPSFHTYPLARHAKCEQHD